MRGVKEEKRQEGTDVKEGKTPIMGHIISRAFNHDMEHRKVTLTMAPNKRSLIRH